MDYYSRGWRVAEFAPGFALFGGNGAGEAYAWDLRDSRRSNYVVIPFIFEPAAAVPVGNTFEEFLWILYGVSRSKGDCQTVDRRFESDGALDLT